jgi:nucleoside-diphosphate kinase
MEFFLVFPHALSRESGMEKKKSFLVLLFTSLLTFSSPMLLAMSQGENEMQRTLIIFKPDSMNQGRLGTILERFEAAKLRPVGAKMLRLTEEMLRKHYAHLADMPFFGDIVTYMTATPVLLMVLEGDGAVARARTIVGPTDSSTAPKGTIRGDFGKDKSRNMVHASEDEIAATQEIEHFFSPSEIL